MEQSADHLPSSIKPEVQTSFGSRSRNGNTAADGDEESGSAKYFKTRYRETAEMVAVMIKFVGIVAMLALLSFACMLIVLVAFRPTDSILVSPAASQKFISLIFMFVLLSLSTIMLYCVNDKPEGKVIVLLAVVFIGGGMCGFILFTMFEQLSA